MKKVAILGGGMAGLSTAWALSGARCRNRYEVTVYQRGWRLGGKGASGRGPHGRIEEHGLHVWLGYYDNAFRMMRRVYAELDRGSSDPACPIRGFDEAFLPTDRVGIGDFAERDVSTWMATFSGNEEEPGRKGDPANARGAVRRFLRRALMLLDDFVESLEPEVGSAPPTIVLSGSPQTPGRKDGDADRLISRSHIAAMIAALETTRLTEDLAGRSASIRSLFLRRLSTVQEAVWEKVNASIESRRSAEFVDLLLTCIRGVIADGLLSSRTGFLAVDDIELRDWLTKHGAAPQSLQSAIVKGTYDLVFGYRDGDFSQPWVSAGVGLFLAGKMFFDYKGSIFWKMAAGMGDIVFAPLYQALRNRGVRFEFFHRVDGLHLDPTGRRIEAVTMGRQADLIGADYEPLVHVRGLPCFPTVPLADQLTHTVPDDLDKHWASRADEVTHRLVAGVDFDQVVAAFSIGMIPHVCSELLARSARWRTMVERVSTVPTQTLQVWLSCTEEELGWSHPGGTASGYPPPFDTYASMSHVLPFEDWEPETAPRSVAYFCSAFPDSLAADHRTAREAVRIGATELLQRRAWQFWPQSSDPSAGFSWDLLTPHGDGDPLSAQYWEANVDPSDRYVQSPPGSVSARLAADESGVENLFLAGDWTNNGHNGGCIEAAVLSGLEAANAIRGRRIDKGLLGGYQVHR